MNDGLRKKDRDKIVATLKQFPKIERAVLFGSRVTGLFAQTSDIDLALFGNNITLKDQIRIESALEKLDMPYTVDVVRETAIESEKLKDHIAKHGVVFFSNTVKA